ncbi:arogenate dehydratase/prephenate dehydratase 2, chloroplastic-like isoform X1 [Durio zibethinus]|uniref:Arogenate dehydratase n=1 Tax=Durio zibethinus TaxID=66656 RepID=A0A6P5ZJ59_DURZI|nr:arogenate dehydratase/prephenate dehydratase 2, chloroplastic-like isoform X1 [Durio zibethinus]XP_022752465.1 arogenate dehydratase/prephenate dehydratase 2, chloroplastic-like isoform X1 [Durio zibethinus]XP_022752466.1 arogenate dehydratase/prephenate dehydratase 2, chloroplastic-like isoform X1 [Durio zibethinus]
MATATSIVRYPTAPLSRKVTISDQKPTPFVQIPQFPRKRSRFTGLFASLHDSDGRDNNNNNNNNLSNKITKAVGLEKLFDNSPYDIVSKDSLLHPRPLSSTQFSNLLSDDSCLRVAYQGVRGAYSEAAAEKAYPNCEAVPCDQFDAAFQAVEKWLVDRAVLPIENSLGGSIHRNYDLLLRHSLHIVGEVKLAVRHCLLANHGVKIEDLKRVLSHPQALAQCENTLTKIGLSREAIDDTALAAKYVAFQKLKDTGAVASSSAAEIYGLNILAQDIQDDCDNVTRFLMLAREPIIPGMEKPFKTSIVFSLEEGPGVLFKALAVFALRQINLTKIESRPLRNQPLRASDNSNNGSKYFDYLFYVDFDASMAEERAQNALRHLKEFATFLRVLGSYPVDTTMI